MFFHWGFRFNCLYVTYNALESGNGLPLENQTSYVPTDANGLPLANATYNATNKTAPHTMLATGNPILILLGVTAAVCGYATLRRN